MCTGWRGRKEGPGQLGAGRQYACQAPVWLQQRVCLLPRGWGRREGVRSKMRAGWSGLTVRWMMGSWCVCFVCVCARVSTRARARETASRGGCATSLTCSWGPLCCSLRMPLRTHRQIRAGVALAGVAGGAAARRGASGQADGVDGGGCGRVLAAPGGGAIGHARYARKAQALEPFSPQAQASGPTFIINSLANYLLKCPSFVGPLLGNFKGTFVPGKEGAKNRPKPVLDLPQHCR